MLNRIPNEALDRYLKKAMHAYDNPACIIIKEFEHDLGLVESVKRLLKRYRTKNELKERLILNNLIILFNVFNHTAVDLLFIKVDRDDWNSLVTFLIFLNRLPKYVRDVNLHTSEIGIDLFIANRLRSLS